MGLNVSFYCRSSKAGKDGTAPVEVSVIVNGARVILPLPRRENPSEFKRNVECKRNTDIKNYLAAVRLNINHAVTEITESGMPLDTSTLKEYIKYGGIRKKSVEDIFTEYFDLIKCRIGVSMGERQFRKYEITRDKFYECCNKDNSVTTITSGIIEEFISRQYANYKPASVASMCTKLKAVTNYAIGKGYLKVDPWSMVKVQKARPREEWLSDGELQKIMDLEITSPEIEISRQMFLFQCASGISYSDLMKLESKDIQQIDGVWYVAKTRTKTGVKYTSVILPYGVEILRQWGFEVPRKSNQKYNLCLLKIQIMAGLEKHLHSHLGRKVYGSTLLRNGVGIKTVSKALGHSTTAITESTYAFLQSEDIIREISSKMC